MGSLSPAIHMVSAFLFSPLASMAYNVNIRGDGEGINSQPKFHEAELLPWSLD